MIFKERRSKNDFHSQNIESKKRIQDFQMFLSKHSSSLISFFFSIYIFYSQTILLFLLIEKVQCAFEHFVIHMFCNSHDVSHFAALFFDEGAKVSIVKSYRTSIMNILGVF